MSVDLGVSDEQEQLRDSVRRLLADKAPARSALQRDGHDPSIWSQLAEFGLQALIIPEVYGGLGQGSVEAGIVFEELGRALYDGPFLASVGMATHALLLCGDEEACADLLPSMAAGETVATLAVTERDGRWDRDRGEQTTARSTGNGGGWIIDGVKSFVIDALAADVILATAQTHLGPSLFAVQSTSSGVDRIGLDSLDLTRRIGSVTLAAAPARLIGVPGGAASLLDAVTDRVAAAVAAESVGGMRACLDLCVEHAKTRKQFGVPIGSFQAVAHRCVEMLQRAEFGGAAAQYAAAAQAQGSEDAGLAAKVAAAYIGPAYRWVTAETIQVHGGLGFTWDHDAHLYYRRCRSVEHLFGSSAGRFEAVAEQVGL